MISTRKARIDRGTLNPKIKNANIKIEIYDMETNKFLHLSMMLFRHTNCWYGKKK